MIGGALLFGAALYIGVPLTNDAPVAVERYATREEIPGGEQDDRWKTTWLLLRLRTGLFGSAIRPRRPDPGGNAATSN